MNKHNESLLSLSKVDYFASLKYPDFFKMWLASLFAGSSYWALIVVRGWVVFQVSDSHMLVGLVTLDIYRTNSKEEEFYKLCFLLILYIIWDLAYFILWISYYLGI
jgi:hypothetical protein